MKQFIIEIIELIPTLEVFTVNGNCIVKSVQLESCVTRCLVDTKHENLKALIIGSVPILLSPDISPALMARIDHLTVNYGWTLRRNCDTQEIIEFTWCK